MTDYTMDAFRAEMRRRGVYGEAYPDRWKGSRRTKRRRRQREEATQGESTTLTPPRATPTPTPSLATIEKVHGKTIVKVVACSIHPLHLVRVHASGSRSGCPMCQMQIEDLCRALTDEPQRERSTPRDHRPRINQDRTMIVGCTCGWRTPPGTTDSDNAWVDHATVKR